MVRPSTQFLCQSCGAVFSKWSGQCSVCGAWNSLHEQAKSPAANRPRGRAIEFVSLKGTTSAPPRISTDIGELDRVLGGGLVQGSAVLVGGDPGIGKSTLLLQAAARLAAAGRRVAYLSGEEAVDQVRLRAARLGLADAPALLAAATSVNDIVATLDDSDGPQVVVVDSIQTMRLDSIDSAPGSGAQVRACSHELVRLAKQRGFSLFLVGHVTKDGSIAGPRVMEHMVDTVLYFEGERSHQFRILRAVKNRFGPTDEIGVFEMGERGLSETPNPSVLFLAERRGNVSGSCVFAGMEGTRPVLVEIQALTSRGDAGSPRRAVVGWDGGRLAMILAVLEARGGFALSGNDIYLNVAGGLRIGEPAGDLAVAAALLSSATGVPTPADTAVFGEIGLSGEVRAAPQADARIKEAAKLGFAAALAPRRRRNSGQRPHDFKDLVVKEIGHVQDLIALFPPTSPRPGLQPRRQP